jgi:hypothetical protein
MANVGQAAVSLVGLYVGSMVGMPGLGFSLGNMLGQALFPTQLPTVEGPKIADQAITTSAIGAAWPWVFGKDAVAGNVLWADRLINHKHTEEAGGKGGPTQKQVYYTATRSYAVGLCRCPNGPIKGLLRAWRMDKLVYDIRPQQSDETDNAYAERVAASESFADGFTLYTGTADQMPDPTIEAVKGVGNTPAYRGRAYIVFTDEDQTDTGGRMPNWRFEIVTEGDDADTTVVEHASAVMYPWALGDDPRSCKNEHQYRMIGSPSSPISGVWRDSLDAAKADIGGIDADRLAYQLGWSPDRLELWRAFTVNAPGEQEVLYLHFNRHLPDGDYRDGYDYAAELPAGPSPVGCTSMAEAGITAQRRIWWTGLTDAGALPWATVAGIWRIASAGTGESGESAVTNCSNYGVGQQLFRLDDVLIEIRRKPRAPAPPCTPYCTDAYPLLPENSNYCAIDGRVEHMVGYSVAAGSFKALSNLRSAVGVVTDYPLGPVVAAGSGDDTQAFWEAEYAAAVAADAKIRTGLVYGVDYPVVPTTAYVRSYVRHALQAIPPTVGSIVREICEEVGVPSDRIDVSDLTDTVPGYGLSTLMTARQAIQPLQAYQFFDCVESDALLKFPKRGKPIVYTLTTDEMGARFAGEPAPPLVTTQIQQAVELPRLVRVHYKMGAKDYQAGMQQSPPRMTTDSVNAKDVQLAINMDDTKAMQIAQVIHQDDWWGRETYETSVSPALLALEGADCIGIPVEGLVERARIVGVNMTPPLSPLKLSLRRDDDGVYVSYALGAAAVPSSDVLGIAGPSELLIIDGPALDGSANDAGVYVAAWGQFSGWSGAQIMLSVDGGASYKAKVTLLTPATVGRIVGVMPAGPSANVWDYGTVLTIDLDRGDLESKTQDLVLNGGNPAFVGADGRWEAMQFADATLLGVFNGKRRYEVKTLLRGRRGTEWAQGLHQDGDRFVLVGPGAARIAGENADLGRTTKWKAVTLDMSEQTAAAMDHTNQGVALEPYSPGHLEGVRDAGNNILFTWKRRTRLGEEWNNQVDVPLNEASEEYQVTILNPERNAPRMVTVYEPRYLYTWEQQQLDWGVVPTANTLQVRQVSAVVGTGYVGEATIDLPFITDSEGNEPAQPSVAWKITFEGSFDDRDDFYFWIFSAADSRYLTVSGSGKSSFDDYADDLALQLESNFPGSTVSVDGAEVSVSFPEARYVRASGNVTAPPTIFLGQAPAPAHGAAQQQSFIDLYRDLGTEWQQSPNSDLNYRQPGTASFALQVTWKDYATYKAMGRTPLLVPLSWSVFGTSDFYLGGLDELVAAINSNTELSSRGITASLVSVPGSMVRPAVVISATGSYAVRNDSFGNQSGSHPSGFDPKLAQIVQGAVDSPSGDPQITVVSFFNGAGTNVEAGQVYVVTLDGVDYTYTADASDVGTDFAPIYTELAALITGADFTAAYEPAVGGLEITANSPNVPFTCSARASYGGQVALEME